MAKKSKDINRLSVVCGFTIVVLWIVLLFRTFNGSDIFSWGGLMWIIFLIISSLIAFLVGWLPVRLTYWFYCGVKEDRDCENNPQKT